MCTPTGSPVPEPCPVGTYRDEEASYDISHCTDCDEGYACQTVGLMAPVVMCAAGYYCMAGSSVSHPDGESFGDLCHVGYFCPEGTANYQDNPCPRGTFSNTRGLAAESDCTLCDPGR